MAYADLLISTCTVRRNTPGAANAYGYPVPSWVDHLTTEPCRLMATTGREIIVGAEVVIADYKLFLEDVDVTEQDRVIVDSVTYEILLVEDKQNGVGNHHKELAMRVVR